MFHRGRACLINHSVARRVPGAGEARARVLVRGSEGWDPRPRIGSIHAKPEGVNWRDCETVEALKQQEALSLKISWFLLNYSGTIKWPGSIEKTLLPPPLF